MPQQPFRFLHASDFHLERLPTGLAELPEHLRELFVEAPYLAAERVFETAIGEKVDFVLLAGDVVDVRTAGPVAIAFLQTQFDRLRERGIGVHWASGMVDSTRHWPAAVKLPPNVERYGNVEPGYHTVDRHGQPLATIVGAARDRKHDVVAGHFARSLERFTIALAHGPADAAVLRAREIDYWALGGKHNRQTLFSAPHVAHYCGTPQGRSEQEPGAHGCTIVDVDHDGAAHSRFVATDVLRWQHEQVTLATETQLREFERLIEERLAALAQQAPDTDLLIRWSLVAPEHVNRARARHRASETLEVVRARHGFEPPVRWSLAIDLDEARVSPELAGQESILGDFLRELGHLRPHAKEAIDLSHYISQDRLASEQGGAIAAVHPSQRERILTQTATLAVELLGGSAVEEV